MRFDVISLLPAMFDAMRQGITGRAIERGLVALQVWNPRDYADDAHRTVDDRPYGGGPGMVMKVEPLRDAIKAARDVAPDSKVVYLSPQGRVLTQQAVSQMSRLSGLVLVAGRYEGVDERLITAEVDEEWSVGDYELSEFHGQSSTVEHLDHAFDLDADVSFDCFPNGCHGLCLAKASASRRDSSRRPVDS